MKRSSVVVALTLACGMPASAQIRDLFNVFNRNTALVRNNNIASPSFNTLARNLSPRIARVGAVVGF
jgi:hypothetical protein